MVLRIKENISAESIKSVVLLDIDNKYNTEKLVHLEKMVKMDRPDPLEKPDKEVYNLHKNTCLKFIKLNVVYSL